MPLGHYTKFIFLISKYIDLTDQEALMIRWHMSWSDYEFKKHIDKVKEITPAVMAFVTLDIEASEFMDEKPTMEVQKRQKEKDTQLRNRR